MDITWYWNVMFHHTKMLLSQLSTEMLVIHNCHILLVWLPPRSEDNCSTVVWPLVISCTTLFNIQCNVKQHNLIENITRSGGRTAVFMDGRIYITHCNALYRARAHWWQHRQKSIFNPFTHCLYKVLAVLSIEYNITLIRYVCYVQIRESQQRSWAFFFIFYWSRPKSAEGFKIPSKKGKARHTFTFC